MFSKRIKNLKAYKTETSPAKIKLSSNELPYDLPQGLKKRIQEEIAKIPFNRYPDPYANELRQISPSFGE
jgi:histidinol-phosphate aminotransferase